MGNLIEAISGILVVSGMVLIVFIIARYTYLIKKAMINKGLAKEQSNNAFKYMDLGCVVIGLGIGLLVSSIYTVLDISEDTSDLLVWGTLSIFGGLSLIVAQIIRRKFEN
jgi:hypothetical protein